MSVEFAIDVRGLAKHFGKSVAVAGVDIKMPRGEIWGFLGANGSGKTTTIRMICGLLNTTAGSGTCLGYDIQKEAKEIKRRTGYMTQKFSFWDDLTIRENIEFVARLYSMPDLLNAVDDALSRFGLIERQHQLAGALSGGWKQRLALAAVTIHKPRLLLLDEPTAGVDPQARRDFWDEIQRLSREGMSVLVSTHYLDEVERCDRIIYMAKGRKLAEGSVAEVIGLAELVTFRLEGSSAREVADNLKGHSGVSYVGHFGSASHVTGSNRELLQSTLEDIAANLVSWVEVQPSLEDAFVALIESAKKDKQYVRN